MNPQFRQKPFPAGNPLASALVVIVGIIVISLSLAVGFVVFVAIAGFMLIMAAVMGVRTWWLGHRAGSVGRKERSSRTGQPAPRQIIEGEYREVRRPSGDRRDS